MLRSVSSRDIAEWFAFYELEPWGYQSQWTHTALICAVVANTSRGKNQRAFTPQDFMPKLDGGKQTVEEMRSVMEKLVEPPGKKAKDHKEVVEDRRKKLSDLASKSSWWAEVKRLKEEAATKKRKA